MSLLDAIRAVVGERGLLTDPADTAAYVEDWRRLYHGRTPAVIRPANTGELAQVVRLCAEARAPIVPQGGNTSMVGGATPTDSGEQFVLSTARLTRIRDIDPLDLTMTIEAGVTLKAAQNAAAEAGCLLPLSISSEGSANIGGVLAVNAGGNNTVRYGNARDLTLGLEVGAGATAPSGTDCAGCARTTPAIVCGNCLWAPRARLGIITAAVLKLVPRPREVVVAFCALPSVEAALELFGRFQSHDPAAISAFELMSGLGTEFVLRHIEGATLPLAAPAPFYTLVELATPRPDAGLRSALEAVLEGALSDGTVTDAAIAEVRSTARGDLAAARGTFRGAEARRCQREERRVGACLQGA